MNECLPRRRRREDTFKNLSRRLVESQEDAAKKMPSEGNFKKTPSRRYLEESLKKARKEPRRRRQEDAAKKMPSEDNFKRFSRRRRPEDCQSAACFSTEKITVEKHRILSVLGVSFKKALP